MTTSVHLRDLAGDLRGLPKSALITAAQAVEKIAEEEGRPPFRLRGKTVKLTANSEVTVNGDVTRCRVQGVPVGLWVIRDSGARPHLIPKRGRKRKSGYLAGGLRHPVKSPPVVLHHPGSAGKGSWKKVINRAQKIVPQILEEEVHKVVSRG